jgi:hypothetical protein
MEYEMPRRFKVGDEIQVRYLTGKWRDVTVVAIQKLTPERARTLRAFYPKARTGNNVLVCAPDAKIEDTTGFMPAHEGKRIRFPKR